jgi:hypothetical protein
LAADAKAIDAHGQTKRIYTHVSNKYNTGEPVRCCEIKILVDEDLYPVILRNLDELLSH